MLKVLGKKGIGTRQDEAADAALQSTHCQWFVVFFFVCLGDVLLIQTF